MASFFQKFQQLCADTGVSMPSEIQDVIQKKVTAKPIVAQMHGSANKIDKYQRRVNRTVELMKEAKCGQSKYQDQLRS